MPIRIYSLASTNQWVDPCYLVCIRMYHMLLSRIIVPYYSDAKRNTFTPKPNWTGKLPSRDLVAKPL